MNVHSTDPNLSDSNGDGLDDGVIFNAGLDLTQDYSDLTTNALKNESAMAAQLKDLRVGSHMASVSSNAVTLQVIVEESDDLNSWSERQSVNLEIPTLEGETAKFFRYKFKE